MPSYNNPDLKISQRSETIDSTRSCSEKKSILRQACGRPPQLDSDRKPITGRTPYVGLVLSPEVIARANEMVAKQIRGEELIPQRELQSSVDDIIKEPPDRPFVKKSGEASRANEDLPTDCR